MKPYPPKGVISVHLACVIFLFFQLQPLHALEATRIALPDPDFTNFVLQVKNGQAKVARGVYVPGVLALPIVQQPAWNPIYVSNKVGLVTQLHSAAANGVTGLLAHNYLSGELFYSLIEGQEIRIVYGDATIRSYQITRIHRFQKLWPSNSRSDYLDLTNSATMTTGQVFAEYYQGAEHVTFQTCIKKGDVWNWGLLFVVAEPVDRGN